MSAIKAGSPAHKAENRRADRKKVHWRATLETSEGRVDCQIVDISPGGSKIRLAHVLGVDTPVTLVIGDIGEFHGSVAWEESGFAGLKFSPSDLTNGANRAASQRQREAPAKPGPAPSPAPTPASPPRPAPSQQVKASAGATPSAKELPARPEGRNSPTFAGQAEPVAMATADRKSVV